MKTLILFIGYFLFGCFLNGQTPKKYCTTDSNFCFTAFKSAEGVSDIFPFLSNFNILAKLTDAAPNKSGAVWYKDQKIALSECFDGTFSMFFEQGKLRRANEGMAFIMGADNTSIAPPGPNMGIVKGVKSLAIVIDTKYNEGFDCPFLPIDQRYTTDYFLIIENGDFENPLYGPIPINKEFRNYGDGSLLSMRVKYDAQYKLLQVFGNYALRVNLEVDLDQIFEGNTAFVGSSGANGPGSPSALWVGLKSSESTRFGSYCNPGLRFCGTSFSENLFNWIPIGTGNNGAWEPEASAVKQLDPNADLSMLFSPDDLIDVNIRFQVKAPALGGKLGFFIDAHPDFSSPVYRCTQDPVNQTLNHDLLLVDWSPQSVGSIQVCGASASSGYTISRVKGQVAEGCAKNGENEVFWQHNADSKVDSILEEKEATWVNDTLWEVEIDYFQDHLTITVNGNKIYEVTKTFRPGRLGFFSYRQQVEFFNLVIRENSPIEVVEDSICLTDSLKLKLHSGFRRSNGETWTLYWGDRDSILYKGSEIIPNLLKHQYKLANNHTIVLQRKDTRTGCTLRNEISVKIAELPPLFPQIKDIMLCAGTNLLLTVQDYNKTYQWQDSSTSYSYLVDSPGVYAVRAKDHPCKAEIKVRYAKEIVFNIDQDPECEDISMSKVEFKASGGVPPYKYFLDGNLQSTSKIEGLPAGEYLVAVRDNLECAKETRIAVLEHKKPRYTVSKKQVSCYGKKDGQIQLSNLPPGYSVYLNNQPSQDNIFKNLSAGIYTISLLDPSAQCNFEDTVEIIQPERLIQLSDTIELLVGKSLVLVPQFSTTALSSVRWSPNLYISCTSCNLPEVSPVIDMRYHVVAVDQRGCRDTDSIWVNVLHEYPLFFPNAFSPNGDGVNDWWVPFNNNDSQLVTNINCRIFSEQGNLLYHHQHLLPNDQLKGWDGKFRGKAVHAGVYTYTAEVEFSDGTIKLFKGDLHLLR